LRRNNYYHHCAPPLLKSFRRLWWWWWGLWCSGISWTICKLYAPHFKQITTPNTSSLSFYRPDALPDTQPTLSNHWMHWLEGHLGQWELIFAVYKSSVSCLLRQKQWHFDWLLLDSPKHCVMVISFSRLWLVDPSNTVCYMFLRYEYIRHWYAIAVCRGLVRDHIGAWTQISDPTCSRH